MLKKETILYSIDRNLVFKNIKNTSILLYSKCLILHLEYLTGKKCCFTKTEQLLSGSKQFSMIQLSKR
jgi:hypothetical protein